MYDRVLLPTDGSEAAAAAAPHAYSLAERYDAELHVLHAVQEVEHASLTDRSDGRTLGNDVTSDATASLVAEAEERGISATSAVETGAPERAILSYAADHDVDLVVMATHGRSGVGRFVMGSVTERVVRLGETPVVAVKR